MIKDEICTNLLLQPKKPIEDEPLVTAYVHLCDTFAAKTPA